MIKTLVFSPETNLTTYEETNVDLHEQTLHGLLKTIYSQSKDQRTIDLSMIARRIYDVWLWDIESWRLYSSSRYLLKVLN